jgi:N utilization substance protein A
MAITSANQLELLQTAEAVAREKMIEPSLVIEAMEESLARAAKSRYGADLDIRVSRSTARPAARPSPGCAPSSMRRRWKTTRRNSRPRRPSPISPLPRRVATNIWLRAGQRIDPTETEPQIGDSFHEEVPPVDMGRIAAQSAKQVILQKVREAERERQYEEFKDRAGTIINGVVKREEYGNVIVDIGRGEGVLRRNDKIGRESYRNGDRIRCYIKDVRRETRGPQVFLSPHAPEFMAELFKMEVPEIYDGIIEIKAVARDPGQPREDRRDFLRQLDRPGGRLRRYARQPRAGGRERASGREDRHHPVERGCADLPRERAAARRGDKVVLDEDAGKIEVVVPDEQLSLAIGRRGQNVRLPRS